MTVMLRTIAIVICLFVCISSSLMLNVLAAPAMDSRENRSDIDRNGEKDHSKFKALQQEFQSGPEVTKACLSCHEEIGEEVTKVHMWTWKCPSEGEYKHGKASFNLNNMSISPLPNKFACYRCHISYRWEDPDLPLTSPENIDCLICHEQTNGKYDEYRKEWNPNLNIVAQNIGRPTKRNCGTCHFYRSGSDGALRGDLNSKLLDADHDHDVHMDANGLDFDCVDCHITENHKVSARCYDVPATVSNSEDRQRYDCTLCHDQDLHQSLEKINHHIDRVACETCHIPLISKNHYSRMWSDYETAGKMQNGKVFSVKDAEGNKVYSTRSGEWRWGKDLVPEYYWFNGAFKYTTAIDKIDPSRTVGLNYTATDYRGPQSKIYPFKVHRSNQPYDDVNKTLVLPKFTDRNKHSGAYWIDYDWNKAIKAGMEEVGLPYSGSYDFVRTEYLYPIHHTVVPKEKSLKCADCHMRKGGRLSGLKGFYMPGRDRSAILDVGGALAILLTLCGLVVQRLLANANKTNKGDKQMNTSEKGRARIVLINGCHWTVIGLIGMLIMSGLVIHGSLPFMGLQLAIAVHGYLIFCLFIVILSALVVTGLNKCKPFKNEWISNYSKMKRIGSIQHPLLRQVYLCFGITLFLVQLVTGIFYISYNYWSFLNIQLALRGIAYVHTAGAFLISAYLMIHIYLTFLLPRIRRIRVDV